MCGLGSLYIANRGLREQTKVTKKVSCLNKHPGNSRTASISQLAIAVLKLLINYGGTV